MNTITTTDAFTVTALLEEADRILATVDQDAEPVPYWPAA